MASIVFVVVLIWLGLGAVSGIIFVALIWPEIRGLSHQREAAAPPAETMGT